VKINPFLVVIAFAVSALAGYGFFAWNGESVYQWLVAIGSGVTLFIPLSGLLVVSSERRGVVGNIRAVSFLFFALEIISNVVFSVAKLSAPTAYVIVNGIGMLLYVSIVYIVSRALRSE